MSGRTVARWAPLAVAVVATAFLLVRPVGYIGGGGDDQQYLAAARCWAASGGACLPHDHWATRWPVIAPMAAALRLFGDSRDASGVGPLLYWISAIIALGWLGRLWFDRATGLAAAALFSAIPVFTAAALQPSADNAELAFQLAALGLATLAYRRQSAATALAAGLLAALACQVRETSIIFLAAACVQWLVLPSGRRNVLLYAIAGMALGIGAEMAAYALTSGDPFYRYRLALGHGAVPSAELAPGVDTHRSALFNPDFIAGWRREMGIHLWWAIDPWLNLLTTPRLGPTVILASMVGLITRVSLPADWYARIKPIAWLSLLFAAALVYALAVDPKSRMFLLPAAGATLCLAASLVTAWRNGRRAPVVMIAALLAIIGVVTLRARTDPRPLEQAAQRWIAAEGPQIEIDEPTRTALALVPAATHLPSRGSGRPLRLSIGVGGCDHLVQAGPAEAPLARIRDRAGERGHDQLCLLEYTAAGNAVLSRRRSGGTG